MWSDEVRSRVVGKKEVQCGGVGMRWNGAQKGGARCRKTDHKDICRRLHTLDTLLLGNG